MAWWGHPITTGSPNVDYYLGLDVEVSAKNTVRSAVIDRWIVYVIIHMPYIHLTYTRLIMIFICHIYTSPIHDWL
jgi:hypothetical protein